MSFSHLDDGTPETAWQDAGLAELEEVPGWNQAGPDTLLVLAVAHPDDETLGATGLIRSVLCAGGRVELILCTAGEGSHPDSPTHTPEQLRRIRHAEMLEAAEALGRDAEGRLELHQLGLPDGRLAEHTEQIEAAVHRALDRDRSGADAAGSSAGPGPAASQPLLATHYRLDGHTDHEVLGHTLAAVAAERGLALYEFPVWYWHWADPQTEHAWRHWTRWPLDEEAQAVRLAALHAHQSQTRPLSDAPGDEAIVGVGMLEHFLRPFDVVRRTAPDSADSSRAARIFDQLYRDHQDPWRYLTSWYERRKRLITMAVLPQQRYGTVVEVGSSIGVLTAELAGRAERVLALEASELAVERSRTHLAEHANVQVRQAVLPQDWEDAVPAGPGVDLVVLSEVGYFLQPDELRAVLDRAEAALTLSGQLVLCHWRHPIQGWPMDGDTVHGLVAGDPRFRRVSEHRERDFAVEVYARASVAERAVVVVPAHNEQDLLPRCLAALARAADRWEDVHGQGTVVITVAVDHCTDATVARAQEMAALDGRFQVLELDARSAQETGLPDGGTVGAARDAGLRWGVARMTGGDGATEGGAEIWVASTDADTVVPADWLVAQAALAAQQTGAAAAPGTEPATAPRVLVAGTVMPHPGDLDDDVQRLWYSDYEHREDHPHIHGANLGMPWSVYRELGGFPHVSADEDVSLVEAARTTGVPVIATDRTRVVTSGRTDGRTPAGFAGFLRDLVAGGLSPQLSASGEHRPPADPARDPAP
ncbi:PIG-L family deacetylase [Micrococcus terreus]|uniref:PIG-L family deacetylase n=1 Tax=Micrococcus terreus TaxID=574650 RepID=UPI0033F64025